MFHSSLKPPVHSESEEFGCRSGHRLWDYKEIWTTISASSAEVEIGQVELKLINGFSIGNPYWGWHWPVDKIRWKFFRDSQPCKQLKVSIFFVCTFVTKGCCASFMPKIMVPHHGSTPEYGHMWSDNVVYRFIADIFLFWDFPCFYHISWLV